MNAGLDLLIIASVLTTMLAISFAYKHWTRGLSVYNSVGFFSKLFGGLAGWCWIFGGIFV